MAGQNFCHLVPRYRHGSSSEYFSLVPTMCEDAFEPKIQGYLKDKSVFLENKCWDIRASPLGGRGIFANRDILPGELIFVDSPIVIGPRSKNDVEDVCVNCLEIGTFGFCENKCGLKVCSEKCQNSEEHKVECNFITSRKGALDVEAEDKVSKCLTAIRALFLSHEHKKYFFWLKSFSDPKHGILIDLLKKELNFSLSKEEEIFLKLVCSVLDANAFEVVISSNEKLASLRGLYPLGSLANHDCSPNATHVFDNQQRMIARAAVFIPEDTEICHSYTRITWGTMTRRYHLFHTKHFACECSRCRDPTEFGTNLNAIKCEICHDVVLPETPLRIPSIWSCNGCNKVTSADRISFVSSILGSNIKIFEKYDDVDLIFKFLSRVVRQLVPDTNQIVVTLKYQLVWILGHKEGYLLEDLPDHLLKHKERICKEILEILVKLRTGMCKMRGLILYELYLCGKEKIRRNMANNPDEMDKLLKEAANILLYDVGAPEEVKKLWVKCDVFS